MTILPFATSQSYSYLLTLFMASKRNRNLRQLFSTGRISFVIQAITSFTVLPILRQTDFVRGLYLERIAIIRYQLPTQLELNFPPINRTIDSLR